LGGMLFFQFLYFAKQGTPSIVVAASYVVMMRRLV
jgi:hypothetical protein